MNATNYPEILLELYSIDAPGGPEALLAHGLALLHPPQGSAQA